MGRWVSENSENSGGGWVGSAESDDSEVGGSPIFPDYKSAFIRSADSILDSQIDRGSDPESAENSANHQRIPVFTLRIHSLDRGEFMQELILIHAELSARVGRSVMVHTRTY